MASHGCSADEDAPQMVYEGLSWKTLLRRFRFRVALYHEAITGFELSRFENTYKP